VGPAPSALYVSDLDGTLLLPDGTLGERPARRSPSCSPATAPMFALADEALAVANALDEVKRSATGVIDANAAEGVAAWLAAHVLG